MRGKKDLKLELKFVNTLKFYIFLNLLYVCTMIVHLTLTSTNYLKYVLDVILTSRIPTRNPDD